MLITQYVNYYGRKISVKELKPNSKIRVKVQCPICKEIRDIYYISLVKAGHHICLSCIRKTKRKYLNIGDEYGYLTVINHSKKSGLSICKCKCGNKIEVYNYYLKTGHTKSCGCLKEKNFINAKKVKGDKHGMWKGGVSSERERIMQTTKYKNWRTDVFERDNYTCQCCGQVGYKLNVHHIINFAKNKNLRFEIDNGITLCEECHIKFHNTYGRKYNNRKQINDFIRKR